MDKLPRGDRGVLEGELAEAVVDHVEHGGDVEHLLRRREGRVALDVAGHAVDEVRHGDARVGGVGVVVDDCGGVDGAVGAERQQALVPVNVPCKVGVDAVLQHESLEGVAHVRLVARDLRAVHGPVPVDDDPRRGGAVDGGEVFGEPLVLLVVLVVLVAAVDVAEC